ncbi:MAG: transposase [Oscillospiraceae bacterium]|nr:transposase [Oscillospiraceae bacterium]
MKKYSKEFREEALKLSDGIGVKKAASQLGIQYYTLAEWRRETDTNSKYVSYAYDAAGRKISATDKKGTTSSFTYDDAGRLLLKRQSNNYCFEKKPIYQSILFLKAVIIIALLI